MRKFLESLKFFFSGACIDKELTDFLKSKGELTPEQTDYYRTQFFNRKINGRYY